MLDAQLFPLPQRLAHKGQQCVQLEWFIFSNLCYMPFILFYPSVRCTCLLQWVYLDCKLILSRFLLGDCLHRISHLLYPSSSLWLLGRSVRQFGFVASHQSAMSTPGVLLCQCPFNDSSRRKRGGQFAVDTSQIDLSLGFRRTGYSLRVRCSGCAALMRSLPFVSL